MDIILIILGIGCLITGIAGCFLPILPGPPIAYIGVLFLHFTDKVQFSVFQLSVWLCIVIVTMVLDYFVPMLGSKYSGGSKWGNRGCLIGTVIGLFFLPWGIIAGPFLGAIIGEMLNQKKYSQAIRSGIGSLIGFLLGSIPKLTVCFYFTYVFVINLIRMY